MLGIEPETLDAYCKMLLISTMHWIKFSGYSLLKDAILIFFFNFDELKNRNIFYGNLNRRENLLIFIFEFKHGSEY